MLESRAQISTSCSDSGKPGPGRSWFRTCYALTHWFTLVKLLTSRGFMGWTYLISKNLTNCKIFWNWITLRNLSGRHQIGAEFLDKKNQVRIARGRKHVRLQRTSVMAEYEEFTGMYTLFLCYTLYQGQILTCCFEVPWHKLSYYHSCLDSVTGKA